jgi:hypothetical protein
MNKIITLFALADSAYRSSFCFGPAAITFHWRPTLFDYTLIRCQKEVTPRVEQEKTRDCFWEPCLSIDFVDRDQCSGSCQTCNYFPKVLAGQNFPARLPDLIRIAHRLICS